MLLSVGMISVIKLFKPNTELVPNSWSWLRVTESALTTRIHAEM